MDRYGSGVAVKKRFLLMASSVDSMPISRLDLLPKHHNKLFVFLFCFGVVEELCCYLTDPSFFGIAGFYNSG